MLNFLLIDGFFLVYHHTVEVRAVEEIAFCPYADLYDTCTCPTRFVKTLLMAPSLEGIDGKKGMSDDHVKSRRLLGDAN